MKKSPEFLFGKLKVGGNNPVRVIAEIGINHDNKFEQAIDMINIAADAKCDIAKLQLFRAKKMYAKKAGKYKTASGKMRDILDIIRANELPHSWIPKLKKHAEKRGLELLITVCDEESANVLAQNNVNAYKFASYALTHLPLYRHVAQKGKPVLFSCGGGRIEEVGAVIKLLEEEKCPGIGLMHCVGAYPAKRKDLNLNVLKTLQYAFPRAVVGYSDHSSDPVEAPRAAVLLGAKIIEKHITPDKKMGGPDHSFAINPDELVTMVRAIRKAEKEKRIKTPGAIDPVLLGSSERTAYASEQYVRDFAYRCVFATAPIKKGEKLTRKNIAVLRPGENKRGLEPVYYDVLVGKYKASRNIPDNKPLDWNDVLAR